jgi:hypothetical protein
MRLVHLLATLLLARAVTYDIGLHVPTTFQRGMHCKTE